MIGALSSTNVLMMDGSMQHKGIMYGLTQAVCHLTAHELEVIWARGKVAVVGLGRGGTRNTESHTHLYSH